MKRTITALPVEPPFVLHVVRAVLFVWGILSLILTVYLMRQGLGIIDITVLNLFAGTRLLRGSRSWRVFVLAELWYMFIGCIVLVYKTFQAPDPWEFYIWAGGPGPLSYVWATALVACVMSVGVWMHVVLCLPKVRVFFRSPSWSIIEPSVMRIVGRFERLQSRKEYDRVAAQMGELDRAIGELESLREELAGLNVDEVISQARHEADDLLARALGARQQYHEGMSDEQGAS
ncbi:MAG: hypothetical protein ACYS8X_04510 [Planctomycetota bacterium]|jgi:hypothetical protein